MICQPTVIEGKVVIACGPRRLKAQPRCLTFGCRRPRE